MALMNFLRRERDYLLDLEGDQRRLLIATVLYGFAAPMISTFTNTYLWRQSGDPVVLVLFNMAFHFGLIIGFFLNGLALRRIRAAILFLIGCLLQGAAPVFLVLSGSEAAHQALPIGLVLGTATGVYWANRNLFTLNLTTGPKRFKYLSVESSFGMAASILSPLVIGWFLVVGERLGWYSIQNAYTIAAGAGFLLLTAAGFVVLRILHKPAAVTHLTVSHPSRMWQHQRMLEFLSGLTNGFELILPLVILLLFLNGEESVGTVQSVTAILSMIGMYAIGRRVRHKDHVKILGAWTSITFVGKALFGFLYSMAGALLFHAFNGLTSSFRWASLTAILYETIDADKEADHTKRYAYITDRECFLDVGRVIGLGLFLGIYLMAPEAAIRYGLLLTMFFQLLMLILAQKMVHRLPHAPGETKVAPFEKSTP